MGRILRFSMLLIFVVVASCKDKNTSTADTDNLFKYKDYISNHTKGQQSIAAPIRIVLTNPLEQYELTQEIPQEYLQINPKVEGTLFVENGSELVFQPETSLKPDTEYEVTLLLNKLYEDIASEFKKYTFAFKTITPNFKITLGELQSYSKDWQYLTGTLEASDVLDASSIKQVLKVTDGHKSTSVTWNDTGAASRFFNFKIDSIQRVINDSSISISWSGESLNIDNEGSETYTIPGLNKFVITAIKTATAPNAALVLNFSEPLKADQNLNGLVTIQNAESLRYEIDGNVLRVYPSNRVLGEVQITAFEGIQSSYGFRLKNTFSERVSFEQLKPQVRLISKGTILPNAAATPIYFETVNLNAVEVRVIQVFKNNMLQFLQNNNLTQNYNPDLRPVGRRVAYKVITLQDNDKDNSSFWKAHGLDLSELIEVNPGSLYRIEFSFKKEHTSYDCGTLATPENAVIADANVTTTDDSLEERYWDNEIYYWRNYSYDWREQENPCHEAYYNPDRVVHTNLLGSNLGLIIKKGKNRSYHFATTNLLTAQPEPSTKIKLYNFQQQLLSEIVTDASGFALYDGTSNLAFAVAEKSANYAYAKLADGNALSMSKFDISGDQLQKGLQGFTYLERGVHRPGDTAHLTFVLDDKNNPLPAEHPIILEVSDARGKLVQRNVLRKDPVKIAEGLFARKEANFHYFPIPTASDAPTGTWNATIKVGGATFGQNLKIATVKPNRLKVKFDFDEEVLSTNKNATGSVNVKWLHGAPARNLKVDINTKLQATATAFKGFADFQFQDPIRSFNETELQFLNATLNDAGNLNINKKIEVNSKAPGMLKATFTTKVFEGGGDFSIDVFSKNIAPYRHFVGLKSPKAKQYGSFLTDEDTQFEVVSVDESGKPASNRTLDINIFKLEWRWWWNRGRDNLSRYENTTVHRPYQQMTVNTNTIGKASFKVHIPDDDGGRYLIRVVDRVSGHATGRTTYFYRNWWRRPNSNDTESSKILIFSADKEHYQTGEQANISFPSDAGGRALISVENGTEVVSQQWIETTAKETRAVIPITEEMAPNIYVNISLLQPHGSVKNDLPIRLYGVVPLLVENAATRLAPKLELPEVLKPEMPYTVTVSEDNKKPMTYTLAVVDEGLLDLTRFKTPDIHSSFYARQALGVKTFDIFDDVMGAYSLSADNIYAIGGGGIADGAKNKKAQRFKPVVTYLGPFTLKAGQKAKHTLDMPNYVGAVRTMLIAGNTKSAYGKTEETTPVRKPLMVLTSLPRKLSPGETVTIPVTVFAMEKKVKDVSVSIKASKALVPLGSTSKSIRFDALGEQIVNFDFKVNPSTSFQTIEVSATGAGEKASDQLEIDVVNPNPITTKSRLITLEGNQNENISFEPFGTSGTNTAQIEFSTLPPMDFSKRLQYLLQYPHGCVEQTTSAAFPQLFVADVLDLTFEKKKEAEKNIKRAIQKLNDFQLPGGGLGYWPGAQNTDDWGTSYAGHFLLEAKQKGFQLPLTFLNNWLRYQKTQARQWRSKQFNYNTDLVQAYRLYTLALAQQPELASMNRMREISNLSNEAKWRLAAAYALVGKKDVAKTIIQKANINMKPNTYDYRTYGSVFRNRAMALETLVLLEDGKQRELAVSLAKNLSSQNWYSTQETAYALLGLSKMLAKNGGKSLDLSYTQNGKTVTVKTDRAIALRSLTINGMNNQIQIKNTLGNTVYATLTQSGKLPVGQELVQQQKLRLKVTYTDALGKTVDVGNLRQGTELQANLTVYNTTEDTMDNLALTQLLPSGWEIVDTSYTEDSGIGNHQVDYTDTRDDRTNFYFSLGSKQAKSFTVKLNVSYLGDYYLPGSQVEAMYDNTSYARNKGQWVKVIQ